MYKPVMHAGFWGVPFPEFKKPVLIFHDGFCSKILNDNKNSFKVFIQGCEPVQAFYNSNPNFDKTILDEFDLVLYHDESFARGKVNKVFPFGTCRISKNFQKIYTNFEVSFLCGIKNYLPGHNLRQEIYNSLSHIRNMGIKAFYTYPSGTPGDYGPKDYVFNTSQYSIIVENHRNKNYFSEKLIDCLMSDTIPIYWGCSNIEEHFNTKGIIRFDNTNDLISKLRCLTPDIYESKKSIIAENKDIASNYAGSFETLAQFYADRVAREINSLL